MVLDYIEKYPQLSKRALAKKMANDHPIVFKDSEHARRAIRYYTGTNGVGSRIHAINDKMLPAEKKFNITPYVIPVVNNKILVMGDLHIPFQSNDAIRLAVEYGKEREVNTVLLNGDIFDWYSESRFEKDPRVTSLKDEIQAAKDFLHWLRGEFPTEKIVFKTGNHDARVERRLMIVAPELFATDLFHLEDILGFQELRIDIVNSKSMIKAGKLTILHGHELAAKSGGVNPARTAYNYTHKSILVSHFHRSSMHTEPNMDKKVITCWSIGCLCDLYPEYDPYNRWNQGFAVVVTDGEEFMVDNLRIMNGKVVS